MEESTKEQQWLILSTRFYRALLAVYPSAFRLEYGGPMLQLFGDSCHRALREAGTIGLLDLWRRTMLDTVQTAVEEHIQRGVDMSKEKFIKLSGWALMLGGLAMLLSWLAGTRPEYNRFNTRSLAIDRYANAVEVPLMVMALFLVSIGLIGLFLRYGQRAGSFGRFSLGFGALSGVIAAVGSIGLGITDSEVWWTVFFISLTLEFLGLALFGLTNVWQRILPRWNRLPVLAGIWIPLYVLVSITI